MTEETISIRPEQTGDHGAVYRVNERAFETTAEAELVEALRPAARPLISLVALVEDRVVGHILFTPVTVESSPMVENQHPTTPGPESGSATTPGAGAGSAMRPDSGVGSAMAPGAGVGSAMALGPMAVLPEYQNRGIGSRLVRSGLEACGEIGEHVVFVLGHAEYYPRFGFKPAVALGLRYKDSRFDPHFMVAELVPGALGGMSGQIIYHPEFDRR